MFMEERAMVLARGGKIAKLDATHELDTARLEISRLCVGA